VRDEHPIRKQVPQSRVGPALDYEPSDKVEVRAWVDVVGDAGGDDGEDGRGAFAADVEPGE
jgi:hypothetical protein